MRENLSAMILCLDTSVLNQLLDDPDHEQLVRALLGRATTYVTAVNVVEIAKTKTPERREQLRHLAKVLSENREPLALPNDLLGSVTQASYKRATEIQITIPTEQREIWYLLSQPDALLEGGREELIRWAAENERLHRGLAEPLRASFDEMFAGKPTDRPSNAARVLRELLSGKWEVHYSFPAHFYKLSTQRVLPLSQLDNFLHAAQGVWAVFLASVAMSIYHAAVWVPAHGARSTVGVLDLWSSVYLPLCDVFVTNDKRNGGQHEALRIINVLNRRRPRTRVLRWLEFRSQLLRAG